jgi:hypothetical protein
LTREELKKRIATIEEGYEFFLAYAAQGLPANSGSSSEGQVRDFLSNTDEALTGLAIGFAALVDQEQLRPSEPYQSMIAVLERDIKSARAAIQLVLAQPTISSQLVDNLNASIHVRALLTDLFLLDEVLGEEEG